MKRLFSSRKRIAAVATAAVLGLSGGAVIAYFTAGGSGSGAGATGSASTATVIQAAPAAADYSPSGSNSLFPGGSQTVHLTVKNNGAGQQFINKVSLSSVTSNKAGCDSTSQPTWFSMSDVTIGENLAPGATSTSHDGTVTFNDTSSPQDACQGATLTFNYTSS